MNKLQNLLFSARGRNFGLLLLRVLTGLYMAFGHGWGKITGGASAWEKIGGSMEQTFGIAFLPVVWGFLAAFSEFLCSLLVAAGLFTRVAAFFVVCTMLVAVSKNVIVDGAAFVGPGTAELAVIYGITFFSIIIMGGGKYSLDAVLISGRNK